MVAYWLISLRGRLVLQNFCIEIYISLIPFILQVADLGYEQNEQCANISFPSDFLAQNKALNFRIDCIIPSNFHDSFSICFQLVQPILAGKGLDSDDPLLDPHSTSEKDGYDDHLTNDVHGKKIPHLPKTSQVIPAQGWGRLSIKFPHYL